MTASPTNRDSHVGRRWSSLVASVAVAVVFALPVRGEPPVAPGPESISLDSQVLPAAHVEQPATTVGRSATPLSGPAPLGGSAPVPRPLPDWRLLAALGAAFAAVAVYRVSAGRRTVLLPPDVFEVLGEAALGGQQSVRVVRFGPRTLLIGVSSAGAQTLAELTDPQATERVVAACRGAQPHARGSRQPVPETRA
jgi:hypothetical protein